ncbi:MAG: GxxExxY protein [Candidatus Kuenenia sp.]|nr:GxxExxY protein [Candidatus Kuenenia hertensis]
MTENEIGKIVVDCAVRLKQVLTYLKLTDKKLGYLLNFGAELMKDGIFRILNGYI